MHPHSVARNGSFGARAEDVKGHSSSCVSGSAAAGGPRSSVTATGTSATHTPHRALLSPRPPTARSTPLKGLTSRKGSRQSTPLSSRAAASATHITTASHRGSLTSTPARRSVVGSARKPTPLATTNTTAPASATPRTQRHRSSSSLPHTKNVTSARTHVEAARPESKKQSTSYQTPPTPTAPSLAVHARRRSVVRTAQRARRSNIRSGSVPTENEPFFESVTAAPSPPLVTAATPAPVHALKEGKSRSTASVTSATSAMTGSSAQGSTTARRVAAPHSPHSPLIPVTSREATRAAPASLAPIQTSFARAAEGSDQRELFSLPSCSDDDVQRLFRTLLCYGSSEGVWGLHRHLLPFVAANAAAILPVTADELLAFLGDQDAAARCHRSKRGIRSQMPDAQTVSAKTVARFASEVCCWFFCTGVLGCGGALSWHAALCDAHDLDGGLSVKVAEASEWGRSVRVESVRSASARKQAASGDAVASPPPSSAENSPTALPRFLRPISGGEDDDYGVAAGVAEAGGKEGETDGSVRWRSAAGGTATAAAAARASSTFASLDFHAVVEVPPFVTQQAFAQGWRVLQRVLDERAVSNAAAAAENPQDCTVQLRTAIVSAASSATNLSSQISPALRAGLRRAQFYVRLCGFVEVLMLRQCRAVVMPTLKDAGAVESALISRLCTNAAPSLTTTKTATQVRTEVPDRPGFLARYVLQRCLHNAILSCSPAAGAARGVSTATAARGTRNGTAVDTLDVLLTLRSREVERVVQRAARAEGRGEAVAATPQGEEDAPLSPRALPASLLLLFPVPRWSPWQSTAAASSAWADGADASSRCALCAVLLLTLSFGPLVYYVARCMEPDWLPWWDAQANGNTGCRGVGCSSSTADMLLVLLLKRGGAQVAALMPVVLLTLLLGCSRGAAVATGEVQYRLCASQTARLTAPAVATWIYSAWALRTESAVAAAAAERCLSRLTIACRAAAAATTTSRPLQRKLLAPICFALCGSVLAVLLGLLLEQHAMPQHPCVTAVSLCLLCLVTWISVVGTWRKRRRRLTWWLQQQTSLAEGAATDLLHAVASGGGEGWAMECGEGEEQRSLLAASAQALPADLLHLCVMPLPFLEEVVKVHALVHFCRSATVQQWSAQTVAPSAESGSPFAVQCLADFPRHCFWSQLCGRSVVAYAHETAAVAVVERVFTAAVKMAEEVRINAPPLPPLAFSSYQVEPQWRVLLVRLLPWVQEQGPSVDDAHLSDVVAPVVTAAAQVQERGQQSTGGGGEVSAAAAPLDLQLRRASCLSPAQQRLLISTAFVFASLGAPCPRSGSPASKKADSDASGAAQVMACLAHLVHHQLAATRGDSAGASAVAASAAQRREATRRTREALRLTRHVAATQRLGCGADTAPFQEPHYTILPQLEHVLFS